MKARRIQVSSEYLDSVCEWMLEWVKKDDAFTVAGFLQWKGIGYPYLKYFCSYSDKVNNTFEIMKSILHNRWVHLGLTSPKLPAHQVKLMMRYVRLYDSYGLDVEQSMKEAVAEVQTKAEIAAFVENYATDELEPPYREIYDENVNKRRDSKETE